MNFLTDELRCIIRKIYILNDTAAKQLTELGMEEGYNRRDHEQATAYCAKAQGLWYANSMLRSELLKAGLIDILKGIDDDNA